MKKITALLLALSMALGLTACGGSSSEPTRGDTATLSTIMTMILDTVDDLPVMGDTILSDENVGSYLFIPSLEGGEGLASEAMVSAIAHSVVLLRVPDGVDAKKIAKSIEDNADPRKWVCVMAEKTIVSCHNQTILLVMSDTATADAIAANFDALWEQPPKDTASSSSSSSSAGSSASTSAAAAG